MAQLQLTPLVGLPLATGWSQVTTNQEQNLVCALAVSGKNANNSGRELSNLLLSSEIKAEQDVHHLMLDLLRISRNNGNQIQVAMTAQLGSKYILAAFQAEIILKRNGKTGTILQAQTEPRLIVGQAQSRDLLILLTKQAQQFKPKLLKLLTTKSHSQTKARPADKANRQPKTGLKSGPDRIATQLVTEIHSVDDSAQTAIALLYHPIQQTTKQNSETKQNTVPTDSDLSSSPDSTAVASATGSDQPFRKKRSDKQQIDQFKTEKYKLRTKTTSRKPVSPAQAPTYPLKPEHEAAIASSQAKPSVSTERASTDKQSGLKLSHWLKSAINFIGKQLKTVLTTTQDIATKTGGRIGGSIRAAPQIGRRVTTSLADGAARIKHSQSGPKNKAGKTDKVDSGQPDIYLTTNTKRKLARITLAILMTAALAFGGWFFYQQQITQKKQRVRAEIQPGVTALQQAQAEPNLHLAREGIKESIKLLTAKLKKYEKDAISRQVIKQYLQQAQQYYQDISGQIELNQLEIFFDLRHIDPTFTTSQATANDQALFFLDQGKQTVIQLNVADQTTRVLDLQAAAQVAGAELDINPEQIQITDLTASSSQLLLLGQGIYSYQLTAGPLENGEGGQTATQAAETTLAEPALTEASTPLVQIKQEGDSDRSATLIEYFNNYLYVFNPERRNIYRYIMQEASLSDPIGWLTNKQGLEFTEIIDFSINGFIWLSDNTGRVLKLSKGEPVADFQLSGVDPALKGNLRLTSHPDLEQVFVLAADQNRVIILNQEGQFLKEISSSSLAASQQILVSPDQEALFAVSGSLIYKLPLNDNP